MSKYCSYNYDRANRLTQLLHAKEDGTPLVYFEYQYDKDSRITHVLRETGDHIYLEYDDASRLTSETWKDSSFAEIYAFEWDYDLAGNRVYENNRGTETYFTFDADNAVTVSHTLSSGHSYFTYDSRGNCTVIEEPSGSTYFEYNFANLVTSIKYPSGVSNYFHYDSMLRRYAMEDSDGLRYFSWDYSGLKLLTERDEQGEVTALYSPQAIVYSYSLLSSPFSPT